MPGIDAFLARQAGQQTSRYQGVVVQPDKTSPALAVNVAGNLIPARVMDPLVVSVGDVVVVDVVRETRGQGTAWIMGRAAPGFRPGEATVKTVPPSSETITVTGTDGIDYTAKFISGYTPTVSDRVTLSWNASVPTVLGKVGTVAEAEEAGAAAQPPPPAITSGQSSYKAIDSATYWGPGGWGSWAGDGSHVYQGNYGAGDLTGAWWYGGATAELAGRTVTRLRFVFPKRRAVGSSNSAVTVHLKTHTSARRPGGNVVFGSGAVDVTAAAGQDWTEIDLPLSFAADLQAGGGIAIFGNPYAGFEGIRARPDSGLLIADWNA